MQLGFMSRCFTASWVVCSRSPSLFIMNEAYKRKMYVQYSLDRLYRQAYIYIYLFNGFFKIII